MDVKEAIEWVLEAQCDYIKQDTQEEDVLKYDALTMAIEALKKQKPVKPKVFGNVGDMFFWKCPDCGAEWFENHIHLYCTDCGQRFDMP